MLDRTDESLKPPSARNREQIKFTLEEIKVIKDCNRESFFKRCIPISTILGLGTYYGVKSGYFKPNAKLGATPKVIGAVILGYFIGKVSYQTKCAERIMKLPNSPLGEILRQRRRGQLQESGNTGFGSGISLAPYGNIGSSDSVSDIDTRPSHSFDLDSQRPQFEGLDESFRPSIDNPIYEEEMPPIQKHVTTYEELRKQNREDYQQKRIGNLRDSSTPRPSPVYQRTSTSTNEISSARNKYGDEME